MLRNRVQNLRRYAFLVVAAFIGTRLAVLWLDNRRLGPKANVRTPFPLPGLGLQQYVDDSKSVIGSPWPDQAADTDAAGPVCSDDNGVHHLLLRSLNLTDNIIYYRRCVRTDWSWHPKRDQLVHSRRPLVSPAQAVQLDLKSCQNKTYIPCDPLTLTVSPPQLPRSHSEFVFGVASSYERVRESLPYFTHWLAHFHARLVIILVDADQHDLAPLSALYANAGINAVLLPPSPSMRGLNVHQLHMAIIRDMLSYVTASTRWLGLLDDDTFITSLDSLSDALSIYDPTAPWYVGVLSDSPPSVSFWGLMAYGGAGIFISAPLARNIEPVMEDCLRDTPVGTGDGLLKHCIYEHTPTRLTLLPGLNQHDIHGDLSGFFEADPQPLLTLHHWKTWYSEPVDQMAAAIRWCGDCFLQRWTFGRDTVLTNGYSITVYPDGLNQIDLSQTEATWDAAETGIYEVVFGPLRRKLSPAEKKQYKLAHSGLLPDGSFAQTYVHRANGKSDALDEVIELVWKP